MENNYFNQQQALVRVQLCAGHALLRCHTDTMHKLDSHLLVFLQLLSMVYSEIFLNSCEKECTVLHMVPPRWNHKSTDIPTVALMCTVKSQCSLDVNELLKNYTEMVRPATYTSVDLYFNCTSKAKVGK